MPVALVGPPAKPEESVAVQETITHIRARIDCGRTFRAAIGRASGSPLDGDFAAGYGQDLLSHAMFWMLTAEEHLLTLANALSTGELYAHGPYSLLRGAAEPLGRITWLLDDRVRANQRHQRLLSERRENQEESGKLKVDRKPRPRCAESAVDRLDQFVCCENAWCRSAAGMTHLCAGSIRRSMPLRGYVCLQAGQSK